MINCMRTHTFLESSCPKKYGKTKFTKFEQIKFDQMRYQNLPNKDVNCGQLLKVSIYLCVQCCEQENNLRPKKL